MKIIYQTVTRVTVAGYGRNPFERRNALMPRKGNWIDTVTRFRAAGGCKHKLMKNVLT